MPLIAILVIALQVYCVWHASRNGNSQWIWILVIAPGVGCAAYALAHLAPELFGSWGVRRTARRVVQFIDPQRDQRKLSANLERADTVENRVALARELIDKRDFAPAKELLQQCLAGINATAPDLMLSLARAQFGLGEFAEARNTLESLIKANPDFRSADGHLLYARTLEALGDADAALTEYAVVKDEFSGEEARFAYAELLVKQGRFNEARAQFEEIMQRTRIAPKHYARAQSEWVSASRAALQRLMS
jgi:hypothetical protein